MTGRIMQLAAVALLSASAAPGGDANKPIWLVVTRPIFTETLQPLARQREKDGFQVVVATSPVAKAVGSLGRRPAFLVLVGDDQPGRQDQPWYLPSPRRNGYRWSSHQPMRFASDAALADFDGDLVPEVPVGRLPVRTPEALRKTVAKILAFEARPVSLSDLNLPIWAGRPGYNPMLDSLTTALLLKVVHTQAPRWARPWVISSALKKPWCGWPSDHARLFNQQFKRGGIMACLMGHGSRTEFHSTIFRGQHVQYSARSARVDFATGPPGPPMAIIACSCGDFTMAGPCLAESLLAMPAGPVAVMAATTESHPLPNYYTGVCLLRAIWKRPRRLGELWLAAQKEAMKMRNLLAESLLKNVEGSRSGKKIDLAKLRRDQMLMYALLGDPATRLRIPGRMAGKIDPKTGKWQWRISKPAGASRLLVSLRPPMPAPPTGGVAHGRERAIEAFHAANEAFTFRRLAEYTPDQPWNGTVSQPGILRFVAVGKDCLHAEAVRLKPAATRPSR